MNLEYKHDRIGPDHKLRQDFRNFILVYAPGSASNPALYQLYETKNAPTKQVRDELANLVDMGYSLDYVYQFSTDDIRSFLTYTENLLDAERALKALKKAVKIAYDAGIDYDIFQGSLIDFYEELSNEERPFVNRWKRKY